MEHPDLVSTIQSLCWGPLQSTIEGPLSKAPTPRCSEGPGDSSRDAPLAHVELGEAPAPPTDPKWENLGTQESQYRRQPAEGGVRLGIVLQASCGATTTTVCEHFIPL